MSFKDLHNIQLDYQTKRQDVLQDFYIPCLKEAKIYKRAVGFFFFYHFVTYNGRIKFFNSEKWKNAIAGFSFVRIKRL